MIAATTGQHVRVTLYQGRPCGRIPAAHMARIHAARPELLCLPEYFWVPATACDHRQAAAHEQSSRAALIELSSVLDCVVVGGSLVVERDGKFFNTSPVYERGALVGEHIKVRPTPREVESGVVAGAGFSSIVAGGIKIGVLICADVLDPASFVRMRDLNVDLIVAPTLSPYRADDTTASKWRRDREIYIAGARCAHAAVVKVCGVGRIFGSRLQGRSIVIDASGDVLARVATQDEGRVHVMTVSLPV